MGSTGATRAMDTTTKVPKPDGTEREERLQKFKGNPSKSGGWEFDGNKFTEDWFRKNSSAYDQIEKMTDDEREAFRAWARGHFMDGSQYRKFSEMESSDQRYTRIYDKILDASELKQGIITYRRAGWELLNNGSSRALSIEQIQKMADEGRIVTSKGSMSTAAAGSGLWGMGRSKPVEYEFKIPAGRGRGMWIGHDKINGWGSRQREFMTNRNAHFRVDGVRYDSNKGIHVVTMTYLFHDEHDYD